MLLTWCYQDRTTSNMPVPVYAVLDHIKAIYTFLQDRLPQRTIQNMFSEHPIIFYTDEQMDFGPVPMKGYFLQSSEVRWTDPVGLFDKYKESLGNLISGAFKKSIQRIYPNMHILFTRCGQIQEEPCMEEYALLLVEMAATTPVTRALPDALKIFTFFGKQFPESDEPAVLDEQQFRLKGLLEIIGTKEVL